MQAAVLVTCGIVNLFLYLRKATVTSNAVVSLHQLRRWSLTRQDQILSMFWIAAHRRLFSDWTRLLVSFGRASLLTFPVVSGLSRARYACALLGLSRNPKWCSDRSLACVSPIGSRQFLCNCIAFFVTQRSRQHMSLICFELVYREDFRLQKEGLTFPNIAHDLSNNNPTIIQYSPMLLGEFRPNQNR